MYIEKMRAEILQQVEKDKGNPAVWGCGMQLKDIVGENERLAKIVCEDFDAGRTVQDCEKNIKKYAIAHRQDFGIEKAEEIIREFFGLGDAADNKMAAVPQKAKIINLADLL